MKEFLKNNPTLAFGLGLPLVLVLVFSLAAGIPSLTAVPPKYDVIFATNYNEGYETGYKINVFNGKPELSYTGECGYHSVPQLYRYQAASGSVRRLDFQVPEQSRKNCESGQANKPGTRPVTKIAVPDLAPLTLDTGNPAPDGYQFMTDSNYSSGGILPSLFFSRSYANEPVLRKDGYRIRLPLEKNYYNYYNTRFIGWVVAQ